MAHARVTEQPAPEEKSPLRRLCRDPWVGTAVGLLVLSFALPASQSLGEAFRTFFIYYLSTILWLALAILAMVQGIGRLESRREGKFWRLLAYALAAWLTSEIMRAGGFVTLDNPAQGLAVDCLYLCYYLGVILALDVRPHAVSSSRRTRPIRNLARVSRTVFVVGLFGYFVLLPRILMPADYVTWIPSFSFYVALDLYLIGRLLDTIRVAPCWRWRTAYGLILAATACILLTDSLDLAWTAGRFILESPGPFDALYYLPFFLLVVAARTRHAISATGGPVDQRPDSDQIRGVPLLAYSLSFPMIHLILDLLEWDPEALREAHAILILGGLVLLGGLNLLQNSLIERWAREQRRQREEAEAHSRFLSRHDPLTGLLNRRELERELGLAIARADRTERKVGVMFIDLDNFKNVNDSHGHQAGDAVLQQVAKRIRDCIREVDSLYRYGGDEFVLVLETLERRRDAGFVATRIQGSLSRGCTFDGLELEVAASIGIAVWPEHGRTTAELLDSADKAMYAIKTSGGAGTSFA